MADGMKPFKIEEISSIHDGQLAMEINRAIHQAYLDCDLRPNLGTKRTVTLEIALVPLVEGTKLYRVDVAFTLKKAVPAQGLVVAMKPGNDGLEFRPEIPDNPDQRPLPFQDSDEA